MQNIRHLSQEEITNWFITNAEKPFRAKQVWEWLWKKSARSFAEMTNLSQALREKLEANFVPVSYTHLKKVAALLVFTFRHIFSSTYRITVQFTKSFEKL